MPNLNRHTIALMDNMKMLNVKLVKFIALQQKVRETLYKTEKLLEVSKRLADEINNLHQTMESVQKLLIALAKISYIGPVIKVLQRELEPVREQVKEVKKRVDELEAKIKQHRKKIGEYISFTDRAIYTQKHTQRFLKKEQEQIISAHDTTNTAKRGRYKNLAQERVNNTSKKLNEVLAPPSDIVSAMPRPLNDMKLLSEQINRLSKIIEQVRLTIDKMLSEVNRIGHLVQLLVPALETGIGKLTVKKILTEKKLPGLDALMGKVTDILDPLLEPLVLKVKSIPGLDESIDTLEQVSKKLDAMDWLIKKVTNAITILTGDENPKRTFKRINAGYEFKT